MATLEQPVTMNNIQSEQATSPPSAIDLLIEARWTIPIEPAGVTLENHALAIHQGHIVALLPQVQARKYFSPDETVRLPNHILMPGLVNLHTHAAMTLLRGLADDLPLMEWLKNHIWPAEAKHVSPQFVYDGTRLACAEMLQGGTTCFNDMYFFPKATAEAALHSGIRATIGLIITEFATAYANDAEDYLDKGMALRDELRDEARLSFCLAPHAPYTVSDQSFEKILTLSEQCDLPIHLHLHETAQEISDAEKEHGQRPLERLRRLGLLSPRLIAAHAVHLTEEEITTLAAHGCTIAHCPSANLKLASGIAPVADMIDHGLNVGLGTDGAASNNRLDMFMEMRLAALLAKAQSGRANAIGAHQALRMATLGGAQALGLDSRIGSLRPGKAADLCAIDTNKISLVPCYDAASLVVYSAGREQVSDVWVAGIQRLKGGQWVKNDEIELINSGRLWQNQIRLSDV